MRTRKILYRYHIWSLIRHFIILYVILVCTGCAAVIKPQVSSSEFLNTDEKKPGTIHLYVSEAFRAHKEVKQDISELKEWTFELGPVSIDTFRFALESRFTDVSVKLGEPVFPIKNPGGFFAVVRPEFTSFLASDPVLFKFEDYKAEIGFSVDIYNADGIVILSKKYVGKGVKQGAIGYEDPGHAAYPVAIQTAVTDAVNQIVTDLLNIADTTDKVAY